MNFKEDWVWLIMTVGISFFLGFLFLYVSLDLTYREFVEPQEEFINNMVRCEFKGKIAAETFATNYSLAVNKSIEYFLCVRQAYDIQKPPIYFN